MTILEREKLIAEKKPYHLANLKEIEGRIDEANWLHRVVANGTTREDFEARIAINAEQEKLKKMKLSEEEAIKELERSMQLEDSEQEVFEKILSN